MMTQTPFKPEYLELSRLNPDGTSQPGRFTVAEFARWMRAQPKSTRLPPDRFRGGGGPWRIVVPETTSSGPSRDALLEALGRLAHHRRAASPLFVDVDIAKGGDKAIADWQERNCSALEEGAGGLLLVGSEADLPFLLQQKLAVNHQVGRLSFPSGDAYCAYAARVVRSEEPHSLQRPELVVFAPSSDSATCYSRDCLAQPILEVGESQALSTVPLIDGEARREHLLEALARSTPGRRQLLFSATHGRGGAISAPPGGPLDLGALECHGGQVLSAEDIRALPSALEDGIGVLFACYSGGVAGGVPSHPFLEFGRPAVGQDDRVASVANGLLLHPRGPLGILGHLGMIYGTRLRDAEGNTPPASLEPKSFDRLRAVMDDLSRGRSLDDASWRMGALFRAAYEHYCRTLEWISREGLYDDEDAVTTLFLEWLDVEDLKGWIVLGDPVVRVWSASSGTVYRDGSKQRAG